MRQEATIQNANKACASQLPSAGLGRTLLTCSPGASSCLGTRGSACASALMLVLNPPAAAALKPMTASRREPL